ncbi:bifunctional 3,4-dihydroxy-2-butanone-4-phosphate synthase/GTP cyclohydrolase II [Geotoga petraea]|jgi:3,4-dihydroxy 2-butanone 4-phosphate synthase/GTP cyclohydrolase II|uniref:GTP cyclohydrolase-2 n=1 Tax=Geotoga petraea TaxID=28234 RepID=A0A1G6QEC3_9BACT|nr:bifunctional 3,4-dihydroxy-2-butanone-4-phosphate synthase/GTP cyclohydrolase II [Geotoga petraea]MDK2945865.1 3,4-dihydroxy 2-butanone 4-phosphate synthase / cyclohydrolase [Geotoga sp.]TGG89307.1 bifunctional 3,4-dihydroxy-2-butanone-4-phosphate synthase/GTP cyclohydrolase II [Geotoga petraea]SDC90842.1 3,4-dihydroxy 2-butanone 4-phosphate synthase / GTP cyclohydrolase II [Geotoga petraea]
MFSEIKEAFEQGKPVIITDQKREFEADLVFPSEIMKKEIINFMIAEGKGVLCTVADEKELLNKGFFKMPGNGLDKHSTNFFVPIDYKLSDTGVTAIERCNTIKFLSEGHGPSMFSYPGHVALLGSKPFQERQGHTEASVELVKLLGYKKFATIIEILNKDGDSHDFDFAVDMSNKYGLPMVSIDEIYKEYIKNTKLVYKAAEAKLPTEFGEFKIIGFYNNIDEKEHFALTYGDLHDKPIPVRIHSECVTGDAFSSLKCDCGSQLKNAMKYISENGKGIIIYLRQEGRGIGITNKIKAYSLQDKGLDTVDANEVIGLPADNRDYAVASQILEELGVTDIELLSNNKDKENQLVNYGINVVNRKNIFGNVNEHNHNYLKTKFERFGHDLKNIL